MGWGGAFMATPGPQNWRAALALFIKGVCMGIADIIPGVSGGTIAFITGIYEALIGAIASFDAYFVKKVFTLRWKQALSEVHLRFILCLYIGVSLAIMSSASLMYFLMDSYPVLTWSVFFGLIAGSILIVFREVGRWSVWRVGLLLLGGAGAWYICGLIPVDTPDDLWFMFLCGVVAICAMILPGISGSFLLLVLGKYYYITGALHTFLRAGKLSLGGDFTGAYDLLAGTGVFWAMFFFQAGQLVGIVSFTRFLKWLLSKWHEGTMCLLAGLMIGAMRRIWPWRHPVEAFRDAGEDGQEGKLRVVSDVLTAPWEYGREFVQHVQVMEDGRVVQEVHNTISGLQAQTLPAVLLMLAGFGVVLLVEHCARDNKPGKALRKQDD